MSLSHRRFLGWLAGAGPDEIPVEIATATELVVNLKTAQGLGLPRPQSILIQATQVIQ